jgi:hypothetical protein
MMKSLSKQEAYLKQLADQNRELNSRIEAANKRLEAGKAEGNAVAKGEESVAQVAMPDDVFDPDYLKKLGEAAKKVEQLEKAVSGFQQREAEREQRSKNIEQANSVLEELSGIQEELPALKTKAPIQEIDALFANYLERLGKVAGTDGSMAANIAAMNKLSYGKSDDAKTLRSAVEAEGLVLPEEYETYQKVLLVRNTHQKLQALDPEQTIDQTISYLKLKGSIPITEEAKTEKQPDNKAAQDAARKAAEQKKLDDAAARRQKEVATDVPVGVGGAQGGVDDMSEAEMDRLLDIPASELRKNPSLKARVDALYRKLDMPPLNLNVE